MTDIDTIITEEQEDFYRSRGWPHLVVEGWEDVDRIISVEQTIRQPEIDVMISGRIALDQFWMGIDVYRKPAKKGQQLRQVILDESKKLTRAINRNTPLKLEKI